MKELIAAERHKFYFLVIDSNVDDRFRTSILLQRFGYHISTASSTSEAIVLMSMVSPALIITEAVSEAELSSTIKKDERFSDVPVIVLAKAPDAGLDALVHTGAFAACLTKPLDVEKFYQTIQSVVEKTPRENIRIETCLLARLGGAAEGKKGIVTVLSRSGMFFQTEEPLRPGTHLPVSLEIAKRTIKLETVVLYSYSLEAGPLREPGMGMKFVAISPQDQEFIKAYIREHIEEGILRLDR